MKVWTKYNDNAMDAQLPFTAKEEGSEHVLYSADNQRVGTCSEQAAKDWNELAELKNRENGTA